VVGGGRIPKPRGRPSGAFPAVNSNTDPSGVSIVNLPQLYTNRSGIHHLTTIIVTVYQLQCHPPSNYNHHHQLHHERPTARMATLPFTLYSLLLERSDQHGHFTLNPSPLTLGAKRPAWLLYPSPLTLAAKQLTLVAKRPIVRMATLPLTLHP
jgi:hypothetical protein